MNLFTDTVSSFEGGLLITCSSHEERCLAIPQQWSSWRPDHVVIFKYLDPNSIRERNHASLLRLYNSASEVSEVLFDASAVADSFRDNVFRLKELLRFGRRSGSKIFIDLTVFTKVSLLMLLRLVDDCGLWKDSCFIYTAPNDYFVSRHIPLSYGVAEFAEVPGFAPFPDASRPLHTVIFLGLEGDRAFATYDALQPGRTTLILPDPSFRSDLVEKAERMNEALITLVGRDSVVRGDAMSVGSTIALLRDVLGDEEKRSSFSRVICPLGSKMQAVGAYCYVRKCFDSPAMLYTRPISHHHRFYSKGWSTTVVGDLE